jgi:hypothetical protein
MPLGKNGHSIVFQRDQIGPDFIVNFGARSGMGCGMVLKGKLDSQNLTSFKLEEFTILYRRSKRLFKSLNSTSRPHLLKGKSECQLYLHEEVSVHSRRLRTVI